uniref:Leucine carboxyl methyltransferase 1 n=1 Tax=Oncorhynchus tshawytscha TaxID=74940 RepID=A0A8C8GZE7_ONCTS
VFAREGHGCFIGCLSFIWRGLRPNCSLCGVCKGYWTDPYVQYFVRPVGERRLEEGLLHTMLLNLCCLLLGYYACLRGMNHLDAFLKKTVCNCQIVNLGAGLDTTFWRLKSMLVLGLYFHCHLFVIFVKIHNKNYNVVHLFGTKPLLSKPLIETYSTDSLLLNGHSLDSNRHCIISADLRDIPGLDDKLKNVCKLPTSTVLGCSLIFHCFSSVCQRTPSTLISAYETWKALFRLQELYSYCLSTGWENVDALDMMTVYSVIPQDDGRIEHLEFLDEKELLQQLLQHSVSCDTVHSESIQTQ